MKCPQCQTGTLRALRGVLSCTRFPVCRHKETYHFQVATSSSSKSYIVFDYETSGRSHRHDKIIEIGAVKVRNGQVVDEFEALVNPGTYISAVITQITGIRNSDLIGKPTEEEILPAFIKWIGDVDFMVAHNLSFDARFLKAACIRLGLPLFSGEGVCTLQTARTLNIPSANNKLGTLCDYFGISLVNAHRAIEDVRSTQQLFERLKERGDVPYKAFSEFCKS
ncbi:PolC-type DNA polymerase III [Cytobacillus sp. FJAT-54145]|uniref:PolC-type DNA polymerase III n=1 Tax=Cytobacillus spartinae TaxID=3299023 RepID=A0ABW6KA39_9BACI